MKFEKLQDFVKLFHDVLANFKQEITKLLNISFLFKVAETSKVCQCKVLKLFNFYGNTCCNFLRVFTI